jgi:hypothetical protein
MANKKAGKVRGADSRKLQEIIGRAMTEPGFVKRLLASPSRALAEYQLDKETEGLVLRGIELRGKIDKVGEELQEDFGLKYQSV